ncbi:MAG: TonB-dependent receptor [Myxococcota bacterium]|nr:TonB-dependent receptor [Myxococcota bacterium]
MIPSNWIFPLTIKFILTGIALFSFSASADSTPKKPKSRDIIVIKPSKTPEDEPSASTLLSLKNKEHTGRDLADILETLPGLRMSRIGGQYNSAFASIRGSTPEQVTVYLDEIPLNLAIGGAVDLSTIPLGPLEKAEVYRGLSPNSVGSSSMGGTIKLKTHTISPTQTNLYGEFGSFQTMALRAFVSDQFSQLGMLGSFDLTTSQGNFTFKNDQGTLFPGSESDDQMVQRKNNTFFQGSGMVKLSWKPTQNFKSSVIQLISTRKTGIPGLGVHPSKASKYNTLTSLTGLALYWGDPSKAKIALQFHPYFSWNRSTLKDPLGEIGLRLDQTQNETISTGVKVKLKPQDLRVYPNFVMEPEVLAEIRFEDFRTKESTFSTPPNRRLFAKVNASLTHQFTSVDLRFITHLRYEAIQSQTSMLSVHPTSAKTTPQINHGDWTWRLGALFTPLQSLGLKLNLSHGLRNPSLFELYGNTGGVLGNPTLRPEEGLNLDFGAETDHLLGTNTHLKTSAFLFARWVHDLIQFTQNAQNVAIAKNIESAQIYGLEGAITLDTLNLLRFQTALTILQTKNTTPIQFQQNRKLPQRPGFTNFSRIEIYHHFQKPIQEVSINTEIEYFHHSFLDYANLVKKPGRTWLAVNAHAHFADDWDLGFQLRNILDNQNQDLVGFPLPGRNFMVTLRYQKG